MAFRVLHLLTLAELGGMETSVLPMIRGLDPETFQCEIGVLRGPGPMSERWRKAGIPVSHLNVRREWSPLTISKLARLLRHGRYDVVTLYGVTVNVLGRLAGRMTGQSGIVSVIRGLSNGRSISKTRLWLDRLTFSMAACYVSNSQAVIDHLIAEGFSPEKLRLARTGLSTEPFDAAPSVEEARRRIGLEVDSPPVIACVGNLRPVKDHSLLLRACRELKRKGIQFLLVLVGRGPEEERVRREIMELSLSGFVRLLGPREDIPLVLAASDLFALSSVWEGLPRSIMEAMAGRLAVVATDAGGVRELVVDGHTGFVVPVGQAGPLAEKMSVLLSDSKLRRAMGEMGYQRVKEHFSDAKMCKAMDAVYREVIGCQLGHMDTEREVPSSGRG